MLAFDVANHTYTLEGQLVPSVTRVLEILDDFSRVDPQVLAAAAEFGRHVHHACHLANRGELVRSSLDPALAPYVAAWERFVDGEDLTILQSECPVAHRRLRYAGTLDCIALWRGRRVLIDIKSGAVPATVGAQTAAYAEAYAEQAGDAPQARYCVQLDPSLPTGFKVQQLRDRADWNDFLSALNCYRFKEKHHGIR